MSEEPRDVPRIGRILDAAGLVLFLAGMGFYARAWFGFQGLPANLPEGEAEQWAAIAVADGFLRLQRIGVTLMVVGIVVFVAAWWVAKRNGRSVVSTTELDPTIGS